MKTNLKFPLTMLTGISIGLIGGYAIQAQQVKAPPGYIIAEIEKDPSKPDDPVAMKKYVEEIPKTLSAFGAQTFVASPSNKVQTLEGDAPKGTMVVIAFDSVERARGWYYSPAYEAIKPLRENIRKSRLLLVEGVSHP
jgi:uncharacterized protein (DUF1330 family)